jgi:sulfur-carrier protein adenylyltransferase/sulfurtransferase
MSELEGVPGISPLELNARLESGEQIIVIDVREIWELAIMKLPFAHHIRMIELFSHPLDLPHDQMVVLLCRTGSRSIRTVEMLQSRGYTNVFNLEGGILAWAREVDPSLPQYYI